MYCYYVYSAGHVSVQALSVLIDLLIFRHCCLLHTVFPSAEPVQAELQAAVDWHAIAEQPRRALSSTQLSLLRKVQVKHTGVLAT